MISVHSIRFRLTAWHTLALATVLLGFAAATAAFLGNLTHRRGDRLLTATTHAFLHVFAEEYRHHQHPEIAAGEAVREFRFSGHRVQVFDDATRLVADSEDGLQHLTLLAREFEIADRELNQNGYTTSHDSTPVPTTTQAPEPSSDPFADQPYTPAASAITTIASAGSPLRHLLAAANGDTATLATIPFNGTEIRAGALAVSVDDRPFTLLVLQTEDPEDGVLLDFLQAIAIAVPLALILAASIGYILARNTLTPIVAMGEQAALISAESLHERLAVPNPNDELGRLATIFNGLLGRLETAFAQQRNFMASASHDLRTPVAILRAEADVALARADRSADEYREALEVVRHGTIELSNLVENLFTLARADAGDHPLVPTDFYLEELLSDCVRAARPLAQHHGVTLHFSPDAEAPLHADELLLRRLVMNLLDNAIHHTPAGGRVDIALEVAPDDVASPPDSVPAPPHYRIEIRDTGTGIPPEARPFIFDRFYRADPARTRSQDRHGGGAGLGLPIARWIAEAHGGTLELAETKAGSRGSRFLITLPHRTAVPAR